MHALQKTRSCPGDTELPRHDRKHPKNDRFNELARN